MDNSEQAERILAEAHDWTFAGDCMLLQWMQQISENLENRASSTIRSLEALSTSVNRSGIALENVSNSLTALQYTQFVESRVAADDEPSSATSDADIPATTTATQSSAEVLKTFLQNNIKMLHNCHEKYALDLDDSDEEQQGKQSYIYQPKNPYNDQPLPYVYGSKLWREHWHVGLSDGGNDYSDDEQSEAFSQTSSSSSHNQIDDEVSADTSASVSADAYSAPVATEKTSRHVNVKNVAILQSSSTEERGSLGNVAVTSYPVPQPPFRTHELSAALRDSPPSLTATTEPYESSRTSSTSSLSKQESAIRRPTDLFSEDPPTPTISPSIVAPADATPATGSQRTGLRKPVNLFDDDEFNSLMTDIVAKANVRAIAETVTPPSAAPRTAPKRTVEAVMPATEPIVAATPARLNLFDSPENSPPLAEQAFAKPRASTKAAAINPTSVRITPKSLFDDDDGEDDDFLNIFGSKKRSKEPPTATTAKSLFFADEEEPTEGQSSLPEPVSKTATEPQAKIDLFAAGDLFGAAVAADLPLPQSTENAKGNSRLDLFAADEDDNKQPLGESAPQEVESTRKSRTINIFAEEEDDFFATEIIRAVEEKVAPAKLETAPADVPIMVPKTAIPKLSVFDDQIFTAEDNEKIDDFVVASATEPTRQAFEGTKTAEVVETATVTKLVPPVGSEAQNESDMPPLNISAKSMAAPSSSKYTNIFLDEPPSDDDDEFFASLGGNNSGLTQPLSSLLDAVSYDEPALPSPPPVGVQQPQATAKYAGLQLFSDVPPDDDDDTVHNAAVLPTPTSEGVKSLQHVFYDDLLETMAALQQPGVLKTHSLFDSEPPPDADDLGHHPTTAVVVDVPDKVAQTRPTPAKPLVERAASKLPKVNINVQALLPNAARAKNSAPVAAPVVVAAPDLVVADDSSTSKPSRVEHEQESGILPSICKTRVRVPASRRPSTRRGRQQSYQQSLSEDWDKAEEETAPPRSVATTTTVVADRPALQRLANVDLKTIPDLFQDDDDEMEEADAFFSNIKAQQAEKKAALRTQGEESSAQVVRPLLDAVLRNVEPDEEKRKLQEEEKRIMHEEEKRKIEEENMKMQEAEKRKAQEEEKRRAQEEEKSRVQEEQKRKVQEEERRRVEEEKRKVEEEVKRKVEEEEKRKVQEEEKRKVQEEEKRKVEEEEKRKAQEEEKRKVQEEDEKRKVQEEERRKAQEEEKKKAQEVANRKNAEDDKVTTQEERTKKLASFPSAHSTAPPPLDTNVAVAKTAKPTISSLFSDSDESADDDLFSTKSRGPSTTQHKPQATETKQTTAPPTKPSTSSVFLPEQGSDSDEDLFKKAIEKPVKAAKQRSTLFGSDDDDDEADFLSTLQKPPATATVKMAVKTKSAGLFNDGSSDDDDDFLFSSKTSTARATSVASAPAPPQAVAKQATTAVMPSSITDNPLADLLK